MREELIGIVEYYADFLDRDRKDDIVDSILDAFATDNNVCGKWIPVSERLPENFVSVLGYMTDAGDFPPVRECFTVGNVFFFPALRGRHPVSHWMPLPEPPRGKV